MSEALRFSFRHTDTPLVKTLCIAIFPPPSSLYSPIQGMNMTPFHLTGNIFLVLCIEYLEREVQVQQSNIKEP